MLGNNPFEYEAATKFSREKILKFFIEDFNYSRFIQSKRNIFLVGERGTGKSMTLLYNSFPVKQKKAEKDKSPLNYELICVYVRSNTTLTYRREYLLMDDFQASIISEHFLVLTIMEAIAYTLSKIPNILEGCDEEALRNEFQYTINLEMQKTGTFFDDIKTLLQKEVTLAQRAINSKKIDAIYENCISFSSGVLPLVLCLKKVPKLHKSHFALMIDDAQDLNPHQVKILNSWVAYRDNSLFSFKVATTKVNRPSQLTSSGGTILEGHDFTLVDLEQPYQNKYSDFGKLARKIIQRRLNNISIFKKPEDYFPENPTFKEEIQQCDSIVGEEFMKENPNASNKQLTDYVYKYGRARYFRERSSKANLPPYSGFDVLVHLSTGVIRNLLEPCYWMYDRVLSQKNGKSDNEDIKIIMIPPGIQTQTIIERSRRKWEWLREGLDKSIEGCSREQGNQIYNLFDNLAILFTKRLLHHKSEPRAIVFTISETNFKNFDQLNELLEISRKAQILYTYTSSAKDSGKKDIYYVPNRILWPIRGLDPVGQYSRVSLKARDLWAAAVNKTEIPFLKSDYHQKELGLDYEG